MYESEAVELFLVVSLFGVSIWKERDILDTKIGAKMKNGPDYWGLPCMHLRILFRWYFFHVSGFIFSLALAIN